MKIKLRAVLVLACAAALCVALPATAQDAKPAKAKPAKAKPAKAKPTKAKPTEPAKPKQAAADGHLQVVDAKATTGVEEREPTGETSSFTAGDKATIWMAVRNPEGPSTLKMAWFVDDVEVDTMDIDVGKSWRWRTWAKRRVPKAGAWKVEIRDGDDTVLETVNFTVNGN